MPDDPTAPSGLDKPRLSPEARSLLDAWQQFTNARTDGLSRIVAAFRDFSERLRPLVEAARTSEGVTTGRPPTECHCFCDIRHPDQAGVCLGPMAEDQAVRLTYRTSLVGLVNVPMCSPCAHLTPATRSQRDALSPALSRRWRINPQSLNVEPVDGQPVGDFTAQEWDEQRWPDCPVCGARINVDRIDICTNTDPRHRYICGAWECPNACDIRAALQEGPAS